MVPRGIRVYPVVQAMISVSSRFCFLSSNTLREESVCFMMDLDGTSSRIIK